MKAKTLLLAPFFLVTSHNISMSLTQQIKTSKGHKSFCNNKQIAQLNDDRVESIC